jgi:hypothetical protein
MQEATPIQGTENGEKLPVQEEGRHRNVLEIGNDPMERTKSG